MTTTTRTPASLSAALYDPETAAIYGTGSDLAAARADTRAGLLAAGIDDEAWFGTLVPARITAAALRFVEKVGGGAPSQRLIFDRAPGAREVVIRLDSEEE